MARRTHNSLVLLTLAVALAIAMTSLALGIRAADDQPRSNHAVPSARESERERTVGAEAANTELSVRIELAADARLDRSARVELAEAARRFAISLAEWLYGDRRTVEVAPITARVRQELASAPPYIPHGQIGSDEGQAVQVHVFVQTDRSGLLVVAIRDPRTSYSVPASFERRAGRWQIVHLSTH